MWPTQADSRVLAHKRIDIAEIDDQVVFVEMSMHLGQELLWLVLERWQHLLLIRTLGRWLVLFGGQVEFFIHIIHVVFDSHFVELGFKLRFLVIPLEKRVGSFHQLSIIGGVVTAIKGHWASLARPA